MAFQRYVYSLQWLKEAFGEHGRLNLPLAVKEIYEALWEDIHAATRKKGVRIRSIWVADVAWQGQSGLLNQDELGNDREDIVVSHTTLC